MIEITDKGEYYELNSKRLEAGNLTYSEKKAWLIEARGILKASDKPCVAYTKLDNANMMRMFTKSGGRPYKINLEFDSIWFVWR